MSRKCLIAFLIAIPLTFLLVVNVQAHPLNLQPPQEPGAPYGPLPYQDENGVWLKSTSLEYFPQGVVGILTTGGPDDFGYTWDNSIPYAWIDASTGTNTGLSNSVESAGSFTIPFILKFYEKTNTHFYVSRNGLISFSALPMGHIQGHIPDPGVPNTIIAPLWMPLTLPGDGWVKYLFGGVAPNRYLVIQWHKAQYQLSSNESFEFEAILKENGDILFQYGTISPTNSCSTSGIEDSTGLIGLTYIDYCIEEPPSNSAVQFTRPAAAPRVYLNPLFDGAFITPGGLVDYSIVVRNIGDIGADTYDITTSSHWTLDLFAADGVTPLTDTDGDTFVDTGIIAQGAQKSIVVRMHAPAGSVVGDFNNAKVTVSSSLSFLKNKVTRLIATIPASFAQVYTDSNDNSLRLDIIKSTLITQLVSSLNNSYHATITGGPGSSLVTSVIRPSNTGSVNVQEIYYSLVKRDGTILRSLGRLTDHQSATIETQDDLQAFDVAPNGNIGVVWTRSLVSGGQYNYNIYFSILNPGGDTVFGPQNVTNNSIWGGFSGTDNPNFLSPQVAALYDNRFVLAWEYSINTASGIKQEIFYSVRGSMGEMISAPLQMTAAIPDAIYYYSPRLTSLLKNRAYLSWVKYNEGDFWIQFAVISNTGSLVLPPTDLTSGASEDRYSGDVIQLPNGKIINAWLALDCIIGENKYHLRYAIQDADYNVVVSPVCLGTAPDASGGESYPSIAFSGPDKAVITWQDNRQKHIYYSLVNGLGEILVDPMIIKNSIALSSDIEISMTGYGNTAYPDTFADVSWTYWAHDWIQRLYNSGITTGCNFNPLIYCPEQAVTRTQMAVFLIRATHGVSFVPPPPTGIFTDVPTNAWAANYIEQLYADGITTGCNPPLMVYCPADSVTRAQMAAFLLRAKHGAAYNPPDPVGIFSDVPTTHWAAKWIEQLYAEGITTGCSTSPLLYCPEQSVTRAQMAAFLVRTFGLP